MVLRIIGTSTEWKVPEHQGVQEADGLTGSRTWWANHFLSPVHLQLLTIKSITSRKTKLTLQIRFKVSI